MILFFACFYLLIKLHKNWIFFSLFDLIELFEDFIIGCSFVHVVEST